MDVAAPHNTNVLEDLWATEICHGKDFLLSLPDEVTQMILLYLPVTMNILNVALSSRIFCRIILTDVFFVRKHIKTCIALGNDRKRVYHCALRQYNKLPLIYLTCILGDVFEHPICGESAGIKIASYLSGVLSEFGMIELLDWICGSPVKGVDRSYAAAGYDVSQNQNDLVFEAIGQQDCKMLAILLQDSRVDLTCDNYSLFNLSDSMKVAELLCSRIPNGPFLMAVSQGNMDAVTTYLASEDMDPSTSNNLCLLVAIHFNQIDVLKVLQNPHITGL
ncbi:hypothetical protein BJ741DRAFT_711765 [Chytriomyces cf. hyalinus JEL632]|nr:hypothetical protein BJ741DRAFT_711765 [Chytriomyces cf. hyalinus JEL632]